MKTERILWTLTTLCFIVGVGLDIAGLIIVMTSESPYVGLICIVLSSVAFGASGILATVADRVRRAREKEEGEKSKGKNGG